jgi:hypothetical protein
LDKFSAIKNLKRREFAGLAITVVGGRWLRERVPANQHEQTTE